MMDAQLVGTGLGTPSTAGFPVMDLYVPHAVTGKHIIPIITGSEEDAQQAQVLCTQVIGTIPQLPTSGVDWSSFLFGRNPQLGALDASIRKNLSAGGHSNFTPDYNAQPGPNGDQLTVTAKQQETVSP
jgi:hypothetical protein